MPIASFAVARDAIVSKFVTAWNAQTPPIPLLRFEDVKSETPSGNVPWAKVWVKHDPKFRQATLGGKGNRRFRRTGVVTVQIFTPSGEGLTNNDIFAKIALDAFEGESTGADAIEFRNAGSQEIGQDGPWYQTNVTADFEYDEVK